MPVIDNNIPNALAANPGGPGIADGIGSRKGRGPACGEDRQECLGRQEPLSVGIIGGAGYTGGELVRLLLNHPYARIAFVHSQSNAGKRLYDVHEGIYGDTEMQFCSEFDLGGIDVLFLCSAHGKSGEFWSSHQRPERLKVIDLAQDYRDESDGYVYGLPELQRERIAGAQKVANPGCFATAIQLALLPLAASGLLRGDVEVTAITGSTGAGVKPGATTHFSWRSGNISAYKTFSHQHLIEITRTIRSLQPSYSSGINFVPVRGDFTRGIFASVYTDCDMPEEEARQLYREWYSGAAFTLTSDTPPDLKQVVNTNKCILCAERHSGKLVITSVIDNLLKGASGQAVQNMNIMCGLPEDSGLRLKASAF